MCNPTIVLDKIVEKIVGIAFESVGRHLGYLSHFKQNMKDLEVEMNKLQERRRTIQGQIDEAKTNGRVIVQNVSDWLNEGDGLRQGVETFMDEKNVKENVQCFKFSCPDFILRYRLSKEAEKKMGDVKSLIEKANFDTISRRAPPPPELQFPSSGEYVSFDSRTLVFNRIMEALTDSKVNVIGVYGTGGVGKTTMVEKVGEQVKKVGLFDEVVTAVVSQDAEVVKIQGVLADRLSLKLKGETEVGRAFELWNRLNNEKRNLVILDDIWKELNLKDIGIPITDGNKGCKVVLTSRNKRILENMEVDIDFPIQALSEEEAWNLFKKKMGNNVDSQLYDIAYAVCRECGGLPVAIRAVGAALKGKGMYAWKSSLDKLRKSMLNNIEDINPQLFTSLRLSYDHLESKDAKSCFLLCCLFPEDYQVPIEDLARHCMARRLLGQNPDTLEEARDIVFSVVNTLKTSCLLLDGKNDDFVKMHDIVRDVAISIAKDEKAFLVKHGVKEWPETETYEKCLAISLRFETIHELPDELVCPELHTLMLGCSMRKFQPELNKEIPDRFFRGTEKLMVLELYRVTLLPLPSSLGKLMELRMLCLNRCKLGDIAILKDLKYKLEVLRLRGSDIKALPLEVGELTRLRLLDLGDCDELKVIPNGVISKLHRLEELYFPRGPFKKWKLQTTNKEISRVSIDELMSLPRLSTLDISIPSVHIDEWLPLDLGFLNLIRFNITVGSPPSGHRDVQPATAVMVLGPIYIKGEYFNILERLLGKPKWSTERGGLYPSRSFNNLSQLVLEEWRLKYLFSPSCARGLLQLQHLQINRSEIMEAVIGNEGEKDEEIIENVINFSQLKTLRLDRLQCLISFYPCINKATTESQSFAPAQSLFNEKVAFPALQELYIEDVPRITAIWDMETFPVPEKALDSSFSQLRILKVGRCINLVNVVKGFPKMEVRGKEEIKEKQVYHDYVLQFPQLRILSLGYLGGLSSFHNTSIITKTGPLFNHQVAFPTLENLYIAGPNVTAIWDKNLPPTESFCLLRSLEVRGCKKLMNLVPSHMLSLLKNIETLEVYVCPEMEVIVVLVKRKEETQHATNKDIILFPELRRMKLQGLENLKGVCAYKSEDQLNFNVQLPEPRILTLSHSGRLSSFNNTSIITETRPLFNHQVAFPALQELDIESVPKITTIWDMQTFAAREKTADSSFSQLRIMRVLYCSNLVNVVQGFPNMEVRGMEGKKEKQVDNNYVLQFPQLRRLTLIHLERLSSFNNTSITTETRPLFNHEVAFPTLESLCIYDLSNLTEIWDKNLLPTQSFCRLRSLEVRYCKKLMNVVPSNMQPLLRSIEALTVCHCPKMEVIVVLEKREEETPEATNKDIIMFPELSLLRLLDLYNLKGICAYKSEDRLCFNVQVVFPKLTNRKYRIFDWTSRKIFAEATSNKKECATMDESGSGMQLQP